MTDLRKAARERLSYDPGTGMFTWKSVLPGRGRKIKVGDRAGWVTALGYRMIRIGQQHIYAHRLAWLFVYGALPEEMLDHIDGNKDNNAISNLRLTDKSRNGANRGPQQNNTSGFKGVRKHRQKWVAQIHVKGKNTYLGLFETRELAAAAYERAAEREYGEFARTR